MKITIFTILMLLIVGCVPSTKINVFNHTSNNVVVSQKSKAKETLIPPNESKHIYGSIMQSELIIRSKKSKWVYDSKSLSILEVPADMHDYVEKLFPMGYEIILQLEDSGSLYIISKANVVPNNNLSKQPKGYPLHPLE